MFGVLISLTGGEANAVVRNVPSKTRGEKCGFSAFYAVRVRCNPAATEACEAKTNLLFNEHEETISPKMKTAVLMSVSPKELQDIVFQNVEGEFKHENVRDEVVPLAGYCIQMASPTPHGHWSS